MIENNLNNIKSVLDSKCTEYYEYLANVENHDFDDDIIGNLGEDNFEGRFDAVLRDIARKIKLNSSNLLNK